MAHFAEIDDDNIVVRVIVVSDQDCFDEEKKENENAGISFCQNLLGGKWLQTSYNGRIRGKYAAIGDKYDQDLDQFISPIDSGPRVLKTPDYTITEER